MARANLVVEDELLDLFVEAGKGSSVRWIKAQLNDVNIQFVDKGSMSGDIEGDLDTMKSKALVGSKPCFVLFKDAESGVKQWVLIAFVPDNSKVRDRMLYASGQDDVKRALGHSNFSGSIHVSECDDLTISALRGVRKRDLSDAPLTEQEMLAKEEVAQMAAPTDARANAMGMVPFKFTDSFDSKLREFASGSVNLVEAAVLDDENVGLGDKTRGDQLNSENIVTDEPRFYLIRQSASQNIYFVFSCPEGCKIRTRMLYSTCKATITHHIAEIGIDITKVLEVGDPKDIDDLLVLHDTPDENAGKIVQAKLSKPSRPGRGKARLAKKK